MPRNATTLKATVRTSGADVAGRWVIIDRRFVAVDGASA